MKLKNKKYGKYALQIIDFSVRFRYVVGQIMVSNYILCEGRSWFWRYGNLKFFEQY